MAKESRVDRAEYLRRIDAVLRIRLDGAQFHDVLQFASEKGWNLSERQLRNYMQAADNQLAQDQQTGRRRIIALHMGRREALYARAVNTGDYRTALAVLGDLAKLQGLYGEQAQKVLNANHAEQRPKIDIEQAKRMARLALAELKLEEEAYADFELKPPQGMDEE